LKQLVTTFGWALSVATAWGKEMPRLHLGIASIALMAFGAPAANASTFNWTFQTSNGSTVFGSGTITATDQGSGTDSAGSGHYEEYLVTGVTGSFSSNGGLAHTTITGPAPAGAYEFNDNLVFYNTGSGAADLDGVGFALGTYLGSPLYGDFVCQFTTAFTCQLNYESGFGGTVHNTGTIGTPGDEFILSAVTPLPAALPLFATGLGAMGLFGWRRKRKNTAVLAAA
jgi:hypothetical protein